MLKSIRAFFDENIAPAAARDDDHRGVALACAALLVEMMRIDADQKPVEAHVLRRVLGDQFALDGRQVDQLVDMAEQEAAGATDYFQFTSLINREFSQQRKIALVEALWRVAYADDEISAHERHMMRKLESLLHILPADHIAARDRARAAAGRQPQG